MTANFIHRFIPAAGPVGADRTLLLLHGTGADENDLIPLGRALLPGAAMLSPRGRVLERGMPRFFRRLAEGVFDLEDLAQRSEELADFIGASASEYGFDPAGLVAVGFSNGANIAGSVLLRRPGVIPSAVLLSPMIPFEPETQPDLSGTAVFIGAGRSDPMVPRDHPERLAAILRDAGADVTVHWEQSGHTITATEVEAARRWLEARLQQAR